MCSMNEKIPQRKDTINEVQSKTRVVNGRDYVVTDLPPPSPDDIYKIREEAGLVESLGKGAVMDQIMSHGEDGSFYFSGRSAPKSR